MIAELLLAITIQVQPQLRPPEVISPDWKPNRRQTVGLALSGGSAKGFAHIGVLQVLEDAGIEIEVISGSSIGSLIGGLYSIGYTTEMLDSLAKSQDWSALFSDRIDRRDIPPLNKLLRDEYLVSVPIRDGRPQLPAGLIKGQRIAELVTGLTWSVHGVDDFTRFPIPFVAVATDIETGEAIAIDHGYLPDALRASIAFPGAFLPVEVEGRLLVDGGIARNLPAQDARAVGADILICSDVSAPLASADSIESLVDVMNQTVAFRGVESNAEQRELCDVLITPDISELSALSFDDAEEWVRRGVTAASAELGRLRQIAAEAAGPPVRIARVDPTVDSVYVDRIELEGIQRAATANVLRSANLKTPAWHTPAGIGAAVARVYGTGLFASVRYRLDALPERGASARTLVLILEETSRSELGFSYRYESHYKAGILLAASLTDLLHFGSTLKFRVRLGNQIQLGAYYFRVTDSAPPLNISARLEFNRTPIDIFEAGRRIAEAETDATDLSLFGGIAVANSGIVGARLKGEYAVTESAVSPEEFQADDLFYTISGLAAFDSRDRVRFPMRGVHFDGRSEWADKGIGSGLTFNQQLANADLYIPLVDRLSLHLGGVLGASAGAELPPHYQFFMGGANQYFVFRDRQFPFFGLSVQQRSGTYLQILRAALFIEPVESIFLQLGWNGGNTYDEWVVDLATYINGYGLVAGAVTPFGQLRVTLSETRLDRLPRLEIDIGYEF